MGYAKGPRRHLLPDRRASPGSPRVVQQSKGPPPRRLPRHGQRGQGSARFLHPPPCPSNLQLCSNCNLLRTGQFEGPTSCCIHHLYQLPDELGRTIFLSSDSPLPYALSCTRHRLAGGLPRGGRSSQGAAPYGLLHYPQRPSHPLRIP